MATIKLAWFVDGGWVVGALGVAIVPSWWILLFFEFVSCCVGWPYLSWSVGGVCVVGKWWVHRGMGGEIENGFVRGLLYWRWGVWACLSPTFFVSAISKAGNLLTPESPQAVGDLCHLNGPIEGPQHHKKGESTRRERQHVGEAPEYSCCAEGVNVDEEKQRHAPPYDSTSLPSPITVQNWERITQRTGCNIHVVMLHVTQMSLCLGDIPRYSCTHNDWSNRRLS